MEIRKITKEELKQSNRICAVAFEYKDEFKLDENEPFPSKDTDEYGAFDGEKFAARMSVHNHEVYFDGHAVKSAGIGGVATLPEYRRSGAVRGIFEVVFEEMKLKNQYISQLYPFSFAFYNKFGYGAAYERLNLRIPLGILNDSGIDRNSRCKLVDDYKDAALREVYESYAIMHNGANRRGDSLWKEKISENIYEKIQYPYIYYNEKGQPSGYFLHSPDKAQGKRDFKVVEICYSSMEDISGILGFIRNFESDYDHVSFSNMPADEDFSMMFANQYDVARSPAFAGMVCIADAEKIFTLMRYPNEIGSFSIEIDDNFSEHNKGVFDISYGSGKLTDIERKPFGSIRKGADICVSLFHLAKLLYGTDDLLSYRYGFIKGLRINGNTETLKKVFVKKNIYMGDFF